MWAPIEDYALIGNSAGAGLVSRTGSIDWLCLPRFDHASVMAALLGDERHGMWVIAPVNGPRTTARRYRPGTPVVETEIRSEDGSILVTDAMPMASGAPRVVRRIEGLEGRVQVHTQIVLSFDYGSLRPLVRRRDGRLLAYAGPDGIAIDSDVELHQHQQSTVGDFVVEAGDRYAIVLSHFDTTAAPPQRIDVDAVLDDTTRWWQTWVASLDYDGRWREHLERAMIVMKTLTYEPSGGLVTSPTASLPEQLGGSKNWDYRYCWLRDSAFSVFAMMLGGFDREVRRWREWLVRATAGDASKLQPVFGPVGERRLHELEADWLPGYEGSIPVRIGNTASSQFQLDVFGEVMDALFQCRRLGLDDHDDAWALQRGIADLVVQRWSYPGAGIWELRGPSRQYTYSKVMAWVALDRAVQMVEYFGADGDDVSWRRTRDEIRREILQLGWDDDLCSFTQHYGSQTLDASLLLLPQLGFLPPDDERVVGTVEAIQRGLMVDGWLWRYNTQSLDSNDYPAEEGAFLACMCWLADALELQDRRDEAEAVFERVLGVTSDLGLLAEEYDPRIGRLIGNYPLALTHLAVANTIRNLAGDGPARRRPGPAHE